MRKRMSRMNGFIKQEVETMLYATVRNRKVHVKKPDTVIQNGVKVD